MCIPFLALCLDIALDRPYLGLGLGRLAKDGPEGQYTIVLGATVKEPGLTLTGQVFGKCLLRVRDTLADGISGHLKGQHEFVTERPLLR